jgi:NarL family two-component system response regulator LiaR
MHTVVVIDDHPMMRKALASYLAKTGVFSVAGEAASLGEAKELLEQFEESPELVLLDIELKGENGLELIRYFRENSPRGESRSEASSTPSLVAARSAGVPRKPKKKNLPSDASPRPMFLVYSMFDDPFRVQSAIHMGARGYISKTVEEPEIAKALEAILRGEVYIEEHLKFKVSQVPDVYACLTKKERLILDLIQKKFDNKDIARELSLKIRTVENYVSRIYSKTGADGRGDLCRL